MTGPQQGQEPAEHRRFADHLAALEAVSEADEIDLVTAVLRDEDAVMARGAVGRHLDRRADRLLTDSRFPAWAHTLAVVIAEHEFLARRLREWTLLRRIALGEPWTAEELAGASDWCQRTIVSARVMTSPEALGLLAARGRTRRVRNAAAGRLRRLDSPDPA
ncbi:hypothetical protein [Streptomyces sp. NPDC054940]